MFDHVIGLRPEEAARWVTLVERSRPILAKDGMEAVQTFLAERGVAIVQAIALTRALLGPAQTPLRVAIDIVTTSTARRWVHISAPLPPTGACMRVRVHGANQAVRFDVTNRASHGWHGEGRTGCTRHGAGHPKMYASVPADGSTGRVAPRVRGR
ncbi:hypothetical protein ABZ092_06535 [Streptomyces bobili]|uniref:hypothetical protein n=1 Tax=Streptomyces bobili TaxID=67280 RepID=UPI0033BE7B69